MIELLAIIVIVGLALLLGRNDKTSEQLKEQNDALKKAAQVDSDINKLDANAKRDKLRKHK